MDYSKIPNFIMSIFHISNKYSNAVILIIFLFIFAWWVQSQANKQHSFKVQYHKELLEIYSMALGMLNQKRLGFLSTESFIQKFSDLLINKRHNVKDHDIRKMMEDWILYGEIDEKQLVKLLEKEHRNVEEQLTDSVEEFGNKLKESIYWFLNSLFLSIVLCGMLMVGVFFLNYLFTQFHILKVLGLGVLFLIAALLWITVIVSTIFKSIPKRTKTV